MERLFNIVKKGYDPIEVENFVNTLETTIRSYKEKDDTIKNAIINSQIAADNIVRNAELEADRIKRRAISLLDDIQESLNAQKQQVSDFQEEYNRFACCQGFDFGCLQVQKSFHPEF